MCIVDAVQGLITSLRRGMTNSAGPTRLMPVQSVELPRGFCVVLSILSSDRKMHSVSSSNVTSNHTLMSNILPDFSPQL